MRTEIQKPVDNPTRSSPKNVPAEPAYHEWLDTEVETGLAELDAGRGIPAEEIWKSLDLE